MGVLGTLAKRVQIQRIHEAHDGSSSAFLYATIREGGTVAAGAFDEVQWETGVKGGGEDVQTTG